jgi:Protein of unknown function (DUF3443)
MISNKLLFIALILALVTSCSGGNYYSSSSSSSSSSPSSSGSSASSGSNILAVTVNGSLCSTGSYPNKPCVSVTICSPGTSTCQTISDILLDTGSYGLRIFNSLLTGLSLNQVNSGSGSLAECVQYADGSSDWGPVQTADVILGNEPAVQVPIQVIDSNFSTIPNICTNPDISPSTTGFNGILGIGVFAEDCGSACAASANIGMYYVCSGSTCTSSIADLTSQVQNPVGLLPQDNNGVIFQLPTVSLEGMTSVNGSLVLGIGTKSNNSPSGVTTYSVDSSLGEFTTVFNGITYSQSFIDSGSNALYFPAPDNVLLGCTGQYSGFYCPSSTANLSATDSSFTGSPSNTVSFEIGDASSLLSSSNNVFSDLGGSATGYFDWGLPFFLGRTVYVGIDGKASSLGTGPYWAF